VAVFIDAYQSNDAVTEIQSFISSQIVPVVPALKASYERGQSSSESSYRFIYYNGMNWALKASLGSSRRLHRETLHVIGSIRSSFDQQHEAPNEVLARTYRGTWVVAKKVDHRELYVIYEGWTLEIQTYSFWLLLSPIGLSSSSHEFYQTPVIHYLM